MSETLNPPVFVVYDDLKNGIRDVVGKIADIVAFCRAIQDGRIGNVRHTIEPVPTGEGSGP